MRRTITAIVVTAVLAGIAATATSKGGEPSAGTGRSSRTETGRDSGEIQGRAYLDRNGNGKPDDGEPGIASVLVSDGMHVVATDASGRYRLPAGKEPVILAITVPRNHAAAHGFWRRADGSHEEDFALIPQPQQDRFYFIQITDTHVGRVDLVQQFARRVNHFPLPIDFVINTGDLVGGVGTVLPDEAPKQYEQYRQAAAEFRVPLWNMMGNHETVADSLKNADQTHPYYGKGLYRKLYGPTHYSFDWGPVHFVALDGTTLPYQEKLGNEQRAWLAADLGFQPADKPIVLFCHQSLPQLRDAQELAAVLHGHRVLAGFCGHLHSTFNTELAGIPVIHTGAMSGAWWSGPNPDGTPQGFRLVLVDKDRLESVYSNREGDCSLYVSSPPAKTLQSGRVAFQVDVLDFGKPAEVTASLEGQPVAVELAEKHPAWSTWKGICDTTQCDDGAAVLEVRSRSGEKEGLCRMRYLVANGRVHPYHADQPATLKIQVRAKRGLEEVSVNGHPLATIPADTPETSFSFPIPAESLARLTRVSIRAVAGGKQRGGFNVGPISLEYHGKPLYDLRFPVFERQWLGGVKPGDPPECVWYFAMP
jgi:hypothetical protein